MEALKILMPLAITLLTILGAAITYRLQKNIDIKNDLIKQKRDVYRKLLSELSLQISNAKGEVPHKLNALRGEVFVISSDEVTLRVGTFFTAMLKVSHDEKMQGSANDESVENMLDSFAKMVLAMRKDCFEQSNLTLEQIQSAMPFGYSKQIERIISK